MFERPPCLLLLLLLSSSATKPQKRKRRNDDDDDNIDDIDDDDKAAEAEVNVADEHAEASTSSNRTASFAILVSLFAIEENGALHYSALVDSECHVL